jgi:all-trans-8'-apo-beta-carotenal 15,15'-oxygenase
MTTVSTERFPTTTEDVPTKRLVAPPWRCGFENLSREHGFVPLRVEGRLPDGLRGTLYRNGAGRFDVAGERYRHWFDSDGAVTAVRLDPHGRAWGASKLVATPWLERERRAGRRLFGGYDTPLARPFREVVLGDMKNPANTSVLLHEGRLYALCEAGKPFEISTRDLDTVGEVDLDGAVLRAFSAHPHRVPSRRATYGFGLRYSLSNRTFVDCFALRDGFRTERLGSFELDGLRLNHDFAVTARYLVFFFAPFYVSAWKTLLGQGIASGGSYRQAEGTEVVVVPIDQPSRITRFTVPSFCMEHVVNAFDTPSGEIAIDYTHYENMRDMEDFVGSVATGVPKRAVRGTVRRAILSPSRAMLRSELILDEVAEMPRVSPHVESSPHRFSYFLSFAENRPPTTLMKLDARSGVVTRYAPGSGQHPSEAVFVPRERASAETEDDGWLLTLVLDAKRRTSHLQILDAARLEDGPIARCHFDHVIPFGFHGAWAPAPQGDRHEP